MAEPSQHNYNEQQPEIPPPLPSNPTPHDDPSSILRFPNEILECIFTHATAITNPSDTKAHAEESERVVSFQWRYYTASSLALTCRRFHPLASPLLYAELYIASRRRYWGDTRDAFLTVLERLREVPSRRAHCKFLVLELDDPEDLPMAREVIGWMTRASRLELRMSVPPDVSLRLLEAALEQMPALRDLTLRFGVMHFNTMPRLEPLCAILARRGNLRVLSLEKINSMDGLSTGLEERSCPITSLELSVIEGQMDRTEKLLAWPAALEHLALRAGPRARHHGPYSLYDLALGLSIVSHSLRTLHIGYLPQSDPGDFNLTDFAQLEELEVWYTATGTDATPVGNLLAPRLKMFTWVFGQMLIGSYVPTWQAFGQKEDDWLRSLVGLARKRDVPLAGVRVEFHEGYWSKDMVVPDIYPWDRLSQLKDWMREVGVYFRYSPPMMSRKRFYRALRLQQCGSLLDGQDGESGSDTDAEARYR